MNPGKYILSILPGLMEHYATSGQFAGALGQYTDGVIECPSNTGTVAVAHTCSLEDPPRQRPGDHTEHSA